MSSTYVHTIALDIGLGSAERVSLTCLFCFLVDVVADVCQGLEKP